MDPKVDDKKMPEEEKVDTAEKSESKPEKEDKDEAKRIAELTSAIEKGDLGSASSKDSKPEEEKAKTSKDSKKKAASDSDPEKQRKMVMFGSIGLIALLAIVGGVAAFMGSQGDDPTPKSTLTSTEPAPTPTPATKASMLDGVVVSNELAERHPLAIMVENLTLTRPQAGLGEASVVYEAIVEGGITRFMAMYSHTLPAKVGPVRSARQVFVDFAEEYGPKSAYYGHVGGSPDALGRIQYAGLLDLDQYAVGAKAYQRFPKAGVATEHTMFTFPEKLYNYVKDKGYPTESTFTPWKFKDDALAASRPETQTITIPYSSVAYEAKFVYDKATNTYKRFTAGSEHKDANTGKQLAAKNVVLMFVNYQTADAKGRQNVSVVGQGDARIFMDGKLTEAKWKKSSSTDRTIFTDAATGKEIEFNAGQIWVGLPKTGTTITVQ